jgi:Cell division initiation protein
MKINTIYGGVLYKKSIRGDSLKVRFSKIILQVVMLLAVDILKAIRDAESEAENIKNEAFAEAKDILKKANEKAQKEMDEAYEKARQISSDLIREKSDEANKKVEQMLEAERDKLVALRAVGDGRSNRAVSIVIERIVNPNGNS